MGYRNGWRNNGSRPFHWYESTGKNAHTDHCHLVVLPSSAVSYEYIRWGEPWYFASGRCTILPFFMKDVNWDLGVSIHPIGDSGALQWRWLFAFMPGLYDILSPPYSWSVFAIQNWWKWTLGPREISLPVAIPRRKFPSPPQNYCFVFFHLHGSLGKGWHKG